MGLSVGDAERMPTDWPVVSARVSEPRQKSARGCAEGSAIRCPPSRLSSGTFGWRPFELIGVGDAYPRGASG